MIKLTKVLSNIIQESKARNFLDDHEAILFEDSRLFQELADPEFAYEYSETVPDIWEFKDKYGNTLGVQFNPSTKYLDAYYLMTDLNGREVRVFDYESVKAKVDPNSFQGGSDQHRSDTICKILLDEIVPKYLLSKKPSIVKMHPINEYRFNIFWKCAEVIKAKYEQLEIKKLGKEISIVHK
jgi:hypothetical protein